MWGKLAQCLPKELDVRLLLPTPGVFRNSLETWNDIGVVGVSISIGPPASLQGYNSTRDATLRFFKNNPVRGHIVPCAVVLQTRTTRPHRQHPSFKPVRNARTTHLDQRKHQTAAFLPEADRPRRGTNTEISQTLLFRCTLSLKYLEKVDVHFRLPADERLHLVPVEHPQHLTRAKRFRWQKRGGGAERGTRR